MGGRSSFRMSTVVILCSFMPYSTSSLAAWSHETSDGLSSAASGHLSHSATNTGPAASSHGTHAAPAHGTYPSHAYGAKSGSPPAASAICCEHRSSHATSAWPGIPQTAAP